MDWLAAYIAEDMPGGDVTSEALFDAEAIGTARLVARERMFVAGLAVATEVFGRFKVSAKAHMNDGSWVDAGAVLLVVSGPTRGILSAERLALNIVGRMSGIATTTRILMERLGKSCSTARIAGSRKTTPGFRWFEKEAIRIGGGDPHRMSLSDEAMIKDNHREAAGSAGDAVRMVRAAHPTLVVTCEVESLADGMAAAAAGADWILIDNQTPEIGRTWAEAIVSEHPRVQVEASGGISPDTVADYGWADRISLGWLTHHAVSKDVGLDWGSE